MDKMKDKYDYIPFEKLNGKNILVTGACGLIGSAVIDFLMESEEDCHVYAMARNRKKTEDRFAQYIGSPHFHIVEGDVNEPMSQDITFHYMVNAASNAHPNAYALDPVGTMWTNINGTKNLLDYGREHGLERFLYVSSGEVYGNGDVENWKEEDSGYVDCMTMRSCYPTSKRAAETLCVAYSQQYGVETVVARPCHTYGPMFTDSDSRAYAQFVRNARKHEDIVLKSRGGQFRSWLYVKDCASAILTILLKGQNQQAYNVADENSCVTICELAETIADIGGTKVVFDVPSEVEKQGFTVIKKAIFNTNKLSELGWQPRYKLREALEETIRDTE